MRPSAWLANWDSATAYSAWERAFSFSATSPCRFLAPFWLSAGAPPAWFTIAGWRWLFVLEGAPAIVLGVVAFFVLTDWPKEAAWLAPEQRQWITQTLEEEKPRDRCRAGLGELLRSRTVVLLAAAAFFDYFAAYSVIFFLPTILKRECGLSDMRVGLLGAIPYVVAFFAMLFNGWHSDRLLERHWHSAVPLFCTSAGLLVLIPLPDSTAMTVVWFTLTCAFMAFLPTFWAIPTEILSESTAALAVGVINA